MAVASPGGSKAGIIIGGAVLVAALLFIFFYLHDISAKVDDLAQQAKAKPPMDPEGRAIDVTPNNPVQAETRILAESRIQSEILVQNPPPAPKTIEIAQIEKPQNPPDHSEVSQNTQSESSPESSEWTPSPDFRTVKALGRTWTLTLYQSRAIEKLWKAWESGIPELHQAAILEGIESCSKRLRDVFKSNMEAYRALISRGERKGTFRLGIGS